MFALSFSFHNNTRQCPKSCAGTCLYFIIKVVGTTLWGPCLLCMVLGACCHSWMVLLGARHFSWVEVLGACCIVHGWWWCALVSLFLGGDGVPSSVFVHRGTWPLSLLWWSCHRSRVRVVGGRSCLQVLHPSLTASFLCAVVTCRPHFMSSASHVLIIVVCSCHVVVSCPPPHCPMLLLLLCPRCDVAPVLER